jgi:hypothetical protein
MAESIAAGRSHPAGEAAAEKQSRERSTIVFPYGDLNDALEVAKAIAGKYGSQCTPEQLAAQLGHDSVKSGSFRTKLSSARAFGVVEISKDRVAITALGRRIVQPNTEVKAKAEAFLHVPLYKSLYDTYKAGLLPADIAVENEMKRFGVAAKQASKARQAFQRSAAQAGFSAHGANRLVLPAGVVLGGGEATAETDETLPDSRGGGGGGSEPPDTGHPFIRGLFDTLPPAGASWPSEKRKKWLQTAEGIFDLIYDE